MRFDAAELMAGLSGPGLGRLCRGPQGDRPKPLITFGPKDPQPVLPVAKKAQERKISGCSVFLACAHIKTHV